MGDLVTVPEPVVSWRDAQIGQDLEGDHGGKRRIPPCFARKREPQSGHTISLGGDLKGDFVNLIRNRAELPLQTHVPIQTPCRRIAIFYVADVTIPIDGDLLGAVGKCQYSCRGALNRLRRAGLGPVRSVDGKRLENVALVLDLDSRTV